MAAAATGRGRGPARERAFSLLYESTQRGIPVADVLAEEVVDTDPYTVAVLEGVESSRGALDERIARFAKGWTLARMPIVDLIILRLASWELTERDDIPTAVILNEAVELANTYSTDDSGRFVNGVLSSIASELRP